MKITGLVILSALLTLTVFSCKKKDSPPTPVPPVVIIPAVGVSYEGGIIFYLDSTGKHGLMAAPGDESVAAVWGCAGTLCGATGSASGTGAQNTAAILNACDSTGIAAQVCNAFVSSGYSGWYLPSKDELDSMYVHLYLKSIGGMANNYYWSSTESDAGHAWLQYFGTGFQGTYDKSHQFYIRPARAF